MQDLERLNKNKEAILSALRLKGPSLPVRIAKEINVSPLFASAFLSELKAENKVKISNMKVGSSPLYYLPGHENQLENFIQYLNQREREAFVLLKENQVLDDGKQEPVVRVALRALKDFALPIRIRIDGESRLFWKHFSVSDSEIGGIVRRGLRRIVVRSGVKGVDEVREVEREGRREFREVEKKEVKEVREVERVKEVEKKEVKEVREVERVKEVEKKEIKEVKEVGEIEKKEVIEVKEKIEIREFKKEKKVLESEFSKGVKEYLVAKDIEIMETLAERKREFLAKVRIDNLFGKQEYYLFAKDKKSVTDNDLTVALQKAQAEKMTAIVMSNGELSNRGKEYLKVWGNLVKFERLKF